MDSHLALFSGTRTHDMRLPNQLAERLMTERDGPARWIEEAIAPFRSHIAPTGEGVQVSGEAVAVALTTAILENLSEVLAGNAHADNAALQDAIAAAVDTSLKHELAFRLTGLMLPIRPMSLNQVAFMQSLLTREKTLVLGLGPTGTGKTHLGIAAAINQLVLENVKYIVATRPHVIMEGEVLTSEKRQELDYDEQLNALADVFRDLLGFHEFNRLVEEQTIEILPLGRMHGRTFNEAFIIIDDAQNMSPRKMRMAVTRIGQGSRMLITGDAKKSELRDNQPSGLADLLDLLRGSDLADIHTFTRHQIIRNRIVAELEELYESRQGTVSEYAA